MGFECWVMLPIYWIRRCGVDVTKVFFIFQIGDTLLTWVERLLEAFRSAILETSHCGVWNRFRWNWGNHCQTVLPSSCQLSLTVWPRGSCSQGNLTSSQGNLATSGWWRKQVAQVGTDQGLEVADGAPRANCSTSHSWYLPGRSRALMPLPLDAATPNTAPLQSLRKSCRAHILIGYLLVWSL